MDVLANIHNYVRFLTKQKDSVQLAMLFGLNLLRIITLFIAASISQNLLSILHDFLWPASFFIFTLIVAALYIKRVK